MRNWHRLVIALIGYTLCTWSVVYAGFSLVDDPRLDRGLLLGLGALIGAEMVWLIYCCGGIMIDACNLGLRERWSRG